MSTLGAVTGIAAGTGDAFVVMLSGIVLIFVEALSMSAGSYLSSKSAVEVHEKRKKENGSRFLQRTIDGESVQELLQRKKFSKQEVEIVTEILEKERKQCIEEVIDAAGQMNPAITTTPFASGIVMGFFYLMSGIFPLLPYFFFPVYQAILPSIIITTVVLFLLGAWKARITQVSWLKSGFEMMTVSMTAALLGFVIGRSVSVLFSVNLV